jgi:SWI/SNF-related matrix-associated actin-dependent regulator 1 of chromatin subfamily A
MVCDEAHYLKNANTQRSKTVLGTWDKKGRLVYPGIVYKAKRLAFLTGTPIPNKPKELFPLVRALDRDGLGKSFMSFAFRYCAPKQIDAGRNGMKWDFDGHSNLAELQDVLRSSIMVRRLKSEVLKELPPKRRQIIEIPANGASNVVKKQIKGFEKHEKDISELEETIAIASEIGDKEIFKEATENLMEAEKVAFEEIASERKEVALKKLPFVIEHIQNFLSGCESKLIVFMHHHDVVDAIAAALDEISVKYVKVTGKTANKNRQKNVDAFQNDPDIRVFLGNIQAAGVGLTLTAADTCMFVEFSWVPAECQQAEDRLHRVSQTKPTLAQYLVFEGSVESRMLKTMVRKMEVIDAALDDKVENKKLEVKEEEKEKNKAAELISKLGTPYDSKAKEAAALLMQKLAKSCDGARKEDGKGFNKFDTIFGKELASRSTQRLLTNKETSIAVKMARKYRGQLFNDDSLAALTVLNDITDGAIFGSDPTNLF